MTEITELLERVKAATGPDRNIDATLFCAVNDGYRVSKNQFGGTVIVRDGFRWHVDEVAEEFTASIDAALDLAERMLPDHRFAFYTDGQGKGPCCLVMIGDEPVVAQEFGKTLPLAILTALLSALHSQAAK